MQTVAATHGQLDTLDRELARTIREGGDHTELLAEIDALRAGLTHETVVAHYGFGLAACGAECDERDITHGGRVVTCSGCQTVMHARGMRSAVVKRVPIEVNG